MPKRRINMIDACKGLRMHHSALCVSDWEKSKKFYCDGLGFEYMLEFPGFFPEQKIAMIRLPDGGVIEMFSNGKPGLPSADDRTFTAGSYFQYCFQVTEKEDVDQIYEYVINELGGTSYVAPADYDMKHDGTVWAHACFVCGPDGEILEFIKLPDEYLTVPQR